MSSQSPNPQSIAQSGLDALRDGRASHARALFEQAIATGKADAATWLGLAMACRTLKDNAGARSAVDTVIELEPRNVWAILLKADLCAEAGENRIASSLYQQALVNAPPPNQTPAELANELRRAQSMCERYQNEFADYLTGRLGVAGANPDQPNWRFAQSLDLLFGRKQVYFQSPRRYYFPDLPQIQFYDTRKFPWIAELEAATDDIRNELIGVLEEDSAFVPYVAGDEHLPNPNETGLLRNPDWGACFLWKDGQIQERTAAHCPKTMKVLDMLPLCRIRDTTPSVLFSRLKAGARIPPHMGMMNTRLICHLPLIVPGQCALRVGNDTREWVEGKAVLFDDTIEHEAWNNSGKDRVVLLIDVWRPELSEEERRLVADLFTAIHGYTGEPVRMGD